jgi:hypothetical protein
MGDFTHAWDPSHTYLRKLAPQFSSKNYCVYLQLNSYAQCRITYWRSGSLARSGLHVKLLDALIRWFRRTRFAFGSQVERFYRKKDLKTTKTILLFPFCGDTPQSRFHLEIAKAFSSKNLLIVFTGPAPEETLKPEFERQGRVWLLMRDRSAKERRLKSMRLGALKKFLRKSKYDIVGAGSSDFYKLLLSDETRGKFWEILPDRYNIYNPRIAEKLEGVVVFHDETAKDLRQAWSAYGVDENDFKKICIVSATEQIPPLLNMVECVIQPAKDAELISDVTDYAGGNVDQNQGR